MIASSHMSNPKEGDDHVIKRIIRYLKGKPRVAIRYQFQQLESITMYTDSDWAGDEASRKSAGGGVVCWGSHTISWWCKLQANIALSSCEADLKGAIEGIRVQRLAATLGDELSLELKTDASAARGVLLRQLVGKGQTPSSQAVMAASKRCRGGGGYIDHPKSRELRRCADTPVGSIGPAFGGDDWSVLHTTCVSTSGEPLRLE